MVQLVDFSKSTVNSFSQSLAVPVAAAPSSTLLTNFGLFVTQGGNVLLNATIGMQSVGGSPILMFILARNGTPIFTIQTQISSVGDFEDVTFSYVDTNIPTGYYSYTMSVSLVNSAAVNAANVVGPADFSGLSMG